MSTTPSVRRSEAMRRQRGFLFPSGGSSVRNPPPLERAEGAEEGGDRRGGAEVDAGAGAKEEERWSRMLPELLGDIVRRVESSDGRWPLRKSVVSCACVCRRWREVTTGVVRPPTETGKITFPASLKQPGPRDLPIQCFIRRNKKNSTFYLYLSLTQTLVDKGKFLLAAQRFRHGAHVEYIISLDADDLSQGSNAYVGKLRSDFFGTKFKIYDSRPPPGGAKASTSRPSRRFASNQISPQVPAGNFVINRVSYKFNLLKTRGPRRMLCTLQCPPMVNSQEEPHKMPSADTSASDAGTVVLKKQGTEVAREPAVLVPELPWSRHGCLGEELPAGGIIRCPQPSGGADDDGDEPVLLQFGKVGDDMFTMDYREPLSAFQAFAICLTSFGTKFACE